MRTFNAETDRWDSGWPRCGRRVRVLKAINITATRCRRMFRRYENFAPDLISELGSLCTVAKHWL